VKKKSLGIIGFGRFGQLAAKHLKKHFTEVFVSDHVDKRKEAGRLGVSFVAIDECAGKDVVLLCVPISSFRKVLKTIIPRLKAGALVIDTCSVKEEPVRAMKELIPNKCECIGTHPLFGPDTAKDGVIGKKIVLCPVQKSASRRSIMPHIKRFLTTKLGLTVITTTPKEHDWQMARSLALIHILGTALLRTDVKRVNLTTPTHERLVELVDIVKNDSKQLAIDMQTHNRFARKARKDLIRELKKIDGELEAL